MVKKVLKGVLIVILLVGVGAALGLWRLNRSFNQERMQYENEVVSEMKTALNFGGFMTAIDALDSEAYDRVHQLVNDKKLTDVQMALSGELLTLSELTQYYLKNIYREDASTNSFIALNPEVLKEAQALEAKPVSERGALYGAVVAVKDNIAVAGMPTTAGAAALSTLETARDAMVVKQLKAADALIIGKANLSEWANFMSMPSSNGFSVMGGQTKNAVGQYDVGGSSSGSAVAVAMDFCNLALATETSGSIVSPASQNGVVGFKPTYDTVSSDLVIPISYAMDTVGVMGHYVEDVEAVYRVIGMQKPTEISQGFSGARLGLLEDGTEETAAIKEWLIGRGAVVISLEQNNAADAIETMPVMLYDFKRDLATFLANPDVTSPVKDLAAIATFNAEDSDVRMPYGDKIHQMALEETLDADAYRAYLKTNRETAREIIDGYFEAETLDAVVSVNNSFSSVYASAGYPAISIPAGRTPDGEPYGATFVGRPMGDQALLKLFISE